MVNQDDVNTANTFYMPKSRKTCFLKHNSYKYVITYEVSALTYEVSVYFCALKTCILIVVLFYLCVTSIGVTSKKKRYIHIAYY